MHWFVSEFCTEVMQLPGQCLKLKVWGGDKCWKWHRRKKWTLVHEPSGCPESNTFWKGMTQTGMTILHSGLAPCGSMSHVLHIKRGRREEYKLLLTSTQKMWDPKLIVARCSIEGEGKSFLLTKGSKKYKNFTSAADEWENEGFSRGCGIIWMNTWAFHFQSC